jgi:FecR protein
MNRTAPFRINRSALTLALISAAFAGNTEASAGRIDFSIGSVVATRANGQQRPLVSGAELESGDTIRTNDGRAQIRFPDGAYVSLQPDTVFGVNEYKYDGKPDGSERGFFSLLKGAMRAVTGLIGRVNRNTFQITTPTATVGIRGTGGLIAVLPDGSTLIRGSSGIWSLSNASGSIDVPAGTSGLAPADPSQPPRETSESPSVPPAPPGTTGPDFVAGDMRTGTGDPIIPIIHVIPLQSGSGYAIAITDPNLYAPILTDSNATATFDSSGALTDVVFSSALGNAPQQLTLVSGTNAEFGTDGILAWGRWIGDIFLNCDCSAVTLGQNQGLHYVIGMPTPVMPTTGSATYTLLGATRPTYVDGSMSPGLFSGTINVVFGARATASMSFNVAMPDTSYALSGSAGVSGSSFTAFPSVSGSTCPGGSGCSSQVDGFFSGASAERIGVGYLVTDSNRGVNVVGAAAFTK